MSLLQKIKEIFSSSTSEISSIPKNAVLIDVRNPNEHATGVIENSLLIPLPDIQNATLLEKQLSGNTRPIVVFCASGVRSFRAKRQLQVLGYTKVYNGGGIEQVRKLLQP